MGRPPQQADRPLWRRLFWFVALWLGGILLLGIVAYGIRLMI